MIGSNVLAIKGEMMRRTRLSGVSRPRAAALAKARPGELDLVEWIRRAAGAARSARESRRHHEGLILGIGDDGAIFRPSPGEELIFTTDLLIQGIHFSDRLTPASAAGHKALARGLSDIAAMGATPRFCLLSLAVPSRLPERWLKDFFRGFLRLARQTRTALAGGDLARGPVVTADIVVCGSLSPGTALRRNGARPGDEIYVSGRLGGPALGLELQRGRAWKLQLRPQPRIALGQYLRERLRATAAMDLSDGLSLDLRRMCLASKLAADLTGELPVFPGATRDQALHGGEDYELLFTVRPGTKVPRQHLDLPLSRIGTMRRGTAGVVWLDGRPLAPLGWDHFA